MTDEEYDPHDYPAHQVADADNAEVERVKQELESNDFRWLMGHREGRRIMWRLLSMTGLFRNPFVPGDAGLRDFRCGEQNIGQKLWAELHTLCPEMYYKMVREWQSDDRRNKRIRN